MGGLDAAIRHAQATTGDSAKLQNVQALLQAFLQEDTHTAHSTVQKARGFKCAWVDRLVTLRLEAELRERQTDTEGDLLDLSSYVEMQTHMKAMVKFHRQVVEANRDVWKMVIRHDVGMDDLIWVIHRWRAYEQRAEVQYRTMLERYPRNVRLLRAYAFFLQSVQCDVTGAHQYFQEADKLEDAAAMNAEAEAELDRTRMTQVDDTRDAVVVISPEGVIMLTNTNLNRMFG